MLIIGKVSTTRKHTLQSLRRNVEIVNKEFRQANSRLSALVHNQSIQRQLHLFDRTIKSKLMSRFEVCNESMESQLKLYDSIITE